MRILGISNHGLALIAMLVCTLWGIIFMEREMNRRAERDYQELMRSIPLTPVSAPADPTQRLPSVT